MVLSQISNKFYRFQQITKQGKVNVQLKETGKNDYDILIFLDIYVFLYTYVFFVFWPTTNIQYFVNKICNVCINTN